MLNDAVTEHLVNQAIASVADPVRRRRLVMFLRDTSAADLASAVKMTRQHIHKAITTTGGDQYGVEIAPRLAELLGVEVEELFPDRFFRRSHAVAA